MAKTLTPPTRYAQVLAILDTAHGSSAADYQGYGKFWHLPLPQLLELKLFGVRMIAPPPAPPPDCSLYDVGADPSNPSPAVTPNPPAPDAPLNVTGAPPATGSCCTPATPATPSCCTPASTRSTPGRGDASGLIMALRGQPPFDGGHYPPFMWGGAQVAAADIAFISRWIDDGCPETDAPPASPVKSAAGMLSASIRAGKEAHAAVQGSTNAVPAAMGAIKQRKNIEYLNEDELCRLRAAFAWMMSLNAYPRDNRSLQYWGRLHGNECQHGWEQFLTWHRIFLYEFEQQLQDYDPTVTLPWWDWTMPMYNAGKLPASMKGRYPKSIKATPPADRISAIVPTAHQCWLNADAIARLIAAGVPKQIADLKDYRYNGTPEFWWGVEQLLGVSGAAPWRKVIINQLYAVNPLWYNWRYPGMFSYQGKDGTDAMQAQFHHHYPTGDDVERILALPSWLDFGGGPAYDESFGTLDMEPHNTIHIWSGGFNPDATNPWGDPAMGDMLNNLTAGYDPIFWGHHANCDRLFWQWQQRNPSQQAFDMNAMLVGLDHTVMDCWDMKQLGYEYTLGSAYYPTGQQNSVKHLAGAPAGINTDALKRAGRVELKLHNVLQPKDSFGVRIFLNQPDANEHTPTQGNPNFAGYFSFFGHGDCIGGPGHCDPPPRERRAFDKRPAHHNRARNYRIDLTAAARTLLKKGAKDLQVKLVSVGADHIDTESLIRMDGMSLHYIP